MTDREKLYATIVELDSALKILKEDTEYWHTQRELAQIKESMDEIEKFKFQIIKEYHL